MANSSSKQNASYCFKMDARATGEKYIYVLCATKKHSLIGPTLDVAARNQIQHYTIFQPYVNHISFFSAAQKLSYLFQAEQLEIWISHLTDSEFRMCNALIALAFFHIFPGI